MHKNASNFAFAVFLLSLVSEAILISVSDFDAGFQFIIIVSWFAANCVILLGGVIIRFID